MSEEVRAVQMDPPLEAAYRQLEQELKAAVKTALRKGSRGLLSTYLHTLLAYPDKPCGFEPIYDPDDRHTIITIPPTVEAPDGGAFAKERALLEIVRAERAQGRRVFVYAVYAERHDVVGRLTEILRAQGFRAEALRASVTPEEREEWLERAVRRGVEVLVGNPALVQTGLDLIDFPTLVFYETGYSIYLLRQASRRSWRIGQTRPVRVICLCYHGTMQERALQLMGRKLLSSLMLEGKVSNEGLTALAEGTDIAAELARALTEGLRGVESAETIWRRLSPAGSTLATEDARGTAQGPTELPALATTPPAAVPVPAPPPTHVILTTIIKGRRRSARVVPLEELDRTAGQLGFAWLLADAAVP